MKPWLFAFLVGTMLMVGVMAAEPKNPAKFKPLVLFTAFDPFAGASVNESANVAKEIARQAQAFRAEYCVVPTQYKKAAPEALKCLRALKEMPAVMISMGEAACMIELETRAQNLDRAQIADNAGEIRMDRKISARGDAYVALGLPVDPMLRALGVEEKKRVQVSGDPGAFVCNHIAYELGEEYRKKKIPTYGFIHVPNHDCKADEKDASENARIIVKMLEATLFKDVVVTTH